MDDRSEHNPEVPLDPRIADHRLRQRDYVLRIARAMSAQLDPQELLSLVIRSAVTMTGGNAGAIAIRRDALAEEPLPFTQAASGEGESEVEIVASYHLEPRLVEYVHATSGRPRVTPTPGAHEAVGSDWQRDDAREPEAKRPSAPPQEVEILSASDPTISQASDAVARAIAHEDDSEHPQGTWPRPAPLARVRPIAPREPHHVLTLPLRFTGEEIGRIVVFRSEGATLFTPVDEELLRTFSDQAAVAIGNALLHQRLARSERRLAGVVEHSPAGILLLDGEGRIRSANAAAERVSGRPRSELVGRPLADALPLVDEQGRTVRSPLPAPPKTEIIAGPRRRGRWGAEPLGAGIEDDDNRLAPETRDARRSARGAILPRPPTRAEARSALPTEPREARWVQLSVTPFDEAGAAGEGYVAVVTDLTAWRDAERAKTAFLAGLSHELKTPLSLIRGFAETLGAPELDGEERESFREHAVEVILDETAHLTRMVDQLLLAARASAGALRLDLHEVDVAALADELVGQFAQTHPRLDWSMAGSNGPTILGDPNRLRDVIANLLSNAAKYAPQDTRVTVSVATAPAGGVTLRVRDEGRGIAPEHVGRVFERFWRADETVEGTGLGLYMARAIIGAHGGAIEVEQSEPGQGTTFVVRLPAAPPGGRASLGPSLPQES